MDPETPIPAPQSPLPALLSESAPPDLPGPGEPKQGALRWIFIGPQGLRAGWSVAIFIALVVLFVAALGALFAKTHLTNQRGDLSPQSAFFSELGGFLALLASAWIMALIERRHILDYNLRGPGRTARFTGGLAAGFAALSLLVGALAWGGWLHFGPVTLSGSRIFAYAAVWACVFLLVGCVEEGLMRCYLLFTLTRGINFWWAIGLVGAMCADIAIRVKGHGAWGVYFMALLGLGPCLMLFLKKSEGAGFWYAAWVTSTFFGFGHTGNNGENWIGIFAAGAVGFVWCVSVRLTGSAWWAIGCHAAWDWGESYFYGTADSGLVARGHLLAAKPAGASFWSGGADGPEGSVLVLGVLLVLLIAVVALYGRHRNDTLPAMAESHQAAG
jgi:uncharacterized protein